MAAILILLICCERVEREKGTKERWKAVLFVDGQVSGRVRERRKED